VITTTRTVQEMLEKDEDAPLPLSVIHNYMRINLYNVEALTWTRQEDGQLVSLTIHFVQAPSTARSYEDRRVIGAENLNTCLSYARSLREPELPRPITTAETLEAVESFLKDNGRLPRLLLLTSEQSRQEISRAGLDIALRVPDPPFQNNMLVDYEEDKEGRAYNIQATTPYIFYLDEKEERA